MKSWRPDDWNSRKRLFYWVSGLAVLYACTILGWIIVNSLWLSEKLVGPGIYEFTEIGVFYLVKKEVLWVGIPELILCGVAFITALVLVKKAVSK